MDAFNFLKLSEEIVNAADSFTRSNIARKLVIQTGGKISSTGMAYWEDELGRYICTECGGKYYIKCN